MSIDGAFLAWTLLGSLRGSDLVSRSEGKAAHVLRTRCVTDITYIRTYDGFMYLAVVLDFFPR